MKKCFKFLLALITVGAFSINAKAQKIAYVNVDSLITIMPESKDAKVKSQEHYKQLESTVVSMQQELQTKYQEYTEKEKEMSDLVKDTKQKELQELQQRIQDFQANAQQEIQKKNDELLKPIYEKAKKAIEQVAKENGFRYVLDSSNGAILYSEPADDVFNLVKKKLNLTGNSTAAEDKKPTPEPKKETKK